MTREDLEVACKLTGHRKGLGTYRMKEDCSAAELRPEVEPKRWLPWRRCLRRRLSSGRWLRDRPTTRIAEPSTLTTGKVWNGRNVDGGESPRLKKMDSYALDVAPKTN